MNSIHSFASANLPVTLPSSFLAIVSSQKLKTIALITFIALSAITALMIAYKLYFQPGTAPSSSSSKPKGTGVPPLPSSAIPKPAPHTTPKAPPKPSVPKGGRSTDGAASPRTLQKIKELMEEDSGASSYPPARPTPFSGGGSNPGGFSPETLRLYNEMLKDDLSKPLRPASPKNSRANLTDLGASPRTLHAINLMLDENDASHTTPSAVTPPKKPAANHPKSKQLAALVELEEKITKLRKEIAVEQDLMLGGTSPSPTPKKASKDTKSDSSKDVKPDPKVDDAILEEADKEDTSDTDNVDTRDGEVNLFIHLQELEECLKIYPETLFAYLNDCFANQFNRKDMQEIYAHMACLSGLMEIYKDNEAFIHDSLNRIDQFLASSLFITKNEMCLQEEQKMDLINFQEFFDVVDLHLPAILQKDSALATRLKIKFANLPLREDNKERALYKNLYFDEKEQLNVLIHHFQNKEDQLVAIAIKQLNRYDLTDSDLKRLSKFGAETSRLSKDNRDRLRNALRDCMHGKVPKDWSEADILYEQLQNFFRGKIKSDRDIDEEGIRELYLASKARSYFEKYGVVNRWCHATPWDNLASIVRSVVRVEHRRAYKGAFVSTQREFEFGDGVLVFKQEIVKIDPDDVFIGYEKGTTRWRGLQKAIPMQEKGSPYLCLVGLPVEATKKEKQIIKDALQSRKLMVPVYNVEVVDYLQSEMLAVIGSPNLSERWWGKADIKETEIRRHVNSTIKNLEDKDFKVDEGYLKWLAKFASEDNKDISQDYLDMIRTALSRLMGPQVPRSWRKSDEIFKALKDFYKI